MANEIRLGFSMSYSKNGATLTRAETDEVTQTGDAIAHEIQSIPTSNTALVEAAAIGTPGYVFVKNLDATNFVSVGLTGSYTIKLLAKQMAMFPAAGAIFEKAEGADTDLEYIMTEL